MNNILLFNYLRNIQHSKAISCHPISSLELRRGSNTKEIRKSACSIASNKCRRLNISNKYGKTKLRENLINKYVVFLLK